VGESVYLHQSEGEHPLGKRISIPITKGKTMKTYIISSSDVKYEANISMEDTPLEIVKNFCEENPDDAQYIFSNEKAHQQLLRDGELDEAVSVFELRDVEGHPVRAEWGEPLCQQPDIKEGIAELEAEDMPICFVCSVVAIVA
jgi:hypothetical protein